MSDEVGKPERATQERIIALFRDKLGYTYLDNWTDRSNNSNVEPDLLSAWLTRRGHSKEQISKAIHTLTTEARKPQRDLYENNREVYRLLRYGVSVKTAAGEVTDTVDLIDWKKPENNDFAIAEEVTLSGDHNRRPDLVMYVNGIAVGVIELKNSRESIGKGIRQNLSNQQPEFHPWFFSTIQFVFAGNDSEGLKYGTILTPEKFYVAWKEDEADNSGFKVDKYLTKMCAKPRIIELMLDFVLFDNGWKKLPRPHQYFAIKEAQKYVSRNEGGIIWHTQGSGKSIVMVLLAKWVLEHFPNARVVVLTDRDELDKQIEGVFLGVGEKDIKRTTSGRELLRLLAQPTPRLMCSLIHKFGPKKVDNFEAFIKELGDKPSPTVGDVFVFVDEAHRTQSGKLHRAMRAIMPNAVLIGFTGTPLLKKDRASTIEVFGPYIHTYKFKEAVEDKVVLDLVYEAKDIDQRLGSPEKIDEWFAAKTRNLNEWQQNELKKHWGTMQKVLSSQGRMARVVEDIVFDFATKRRLESGLGNAILVASSIYEACRYYEMFQGTPLKGKSAIVTSYNPLTRDITLEETGANTETEKQFIYRTYTDLLHNVVAKPGKTKTETYEDDVKARFIKEPAQMRLLIVVDKLLTGFDAPPCSYLYIDKSMQDHGLFQAICRTNRVDDETKPFGTIIDYKNLFKKVQGAMSVYSSELDHSAPGPEPEILIQDRLTRGVQRVEDAREALARLCGPVEPPQGELQYMHYFCGNSEIASDLEEKQPRRVTLYRLTADLVRAVDDMADELSEAGYTVEQIEQIKNDREKYVNVRNLVRRHSGEELDIKPYEADMRHLIDTYIEADASKRIFSSDNTGLLELIERLGIEKAIEERFHVKVMLTDEQQDIISETIENNVRKAIIKKRMSDPAYYEAMSALLKEVIAARKSKAMEYQEYLKRIGEIAKQANSGRLSETPAVLDTPGKIALWNNLGRDEDVALRLDTALRTLANDGWRNHLARQRRVQDIIAGVVGDDDATVERIYDIVFEQAEY